MSGPSSEALKNSKWSAPVAAYGGFALAAILLTLPTFSHMAQTWISSSAYHHGMFVAPAAIWMIAAHSWRPEHGGDYCAGWIITAFGALIWLAGQAGGAAIVSQIGLVTILIGGVGAVFGARALQLWVWPLLFLYFMVPIGESVVPILQNLTAKFVVSLLNLFGFDIVIDGILIETRVGAFAIAEACAGLRLLIAALMLSAVFAYVAFEGWCKRIAFLIFAAAFAIFANALRAFFLILIPVVANQEPTLGPEHFVVGWLLYLGVLTILLLVGRRFADRRAAPRPALSPPSLAPLAIALAIGLVATAGAYNKFVMERTVSNAAPTTLTLFDAQGWRILPPPENWRATFPNADRTAAATYQSEGARVYVGFSYFTHDRRGAEIAGGENHPFDGKEWRRIGAHSDVIYLFQTSETRTFQRLAGPERRKLLTLTLYWLGDEVYWSRKAVKLEQTKLKLLGRNPPGGVIVLAASYDREPEEALAVLRDFTADLENFRTWRARLDAQ